MYEARAILLKSGLISSTQSSSLQRAQADVLFASVRSGSALTFACFLQIIFRASVKCARDSGVRGDRKIPALWIEAKSGQLVANDPFIRYVASRIVRSDVQRVRLVRSESHLWDAVKCVRQQVKVNGGSHKFERTVLRWYRQYAERYANSHKDRSGSHGGRDVINGREKRNDVHFWVRDRCRDNGEEFCVVLNSRGDLSKKHSGSPTNMRPLSWGAFYAFVVDAGLLGLLSLRNVAEVYATSATLSAQRRTVVDFMTIHDFWFALAQIAEFVRSNHVSSSFRGDQEERFDFRWLEKDSSTSVSLVGLLRMIRQKLLKFPGLGGGVEMHKHRRARAEFLRESIVFSSRH
eukprot:g3350.t1